ncbi:MAG: FG-GAP-like repeat-containing protein, partial [Thermoplasmata archaeon]
FNGDGRRDIAAGEVLANRTVLQPYIGRVAALGSGELAPAPVNLWGESPYSLFGFCILRGPDNDLNRDGKPDLAIGSPLASPGGKGMVGAVYIFTSPEEHYWLVIQGEQPSSNFSASLAAGDFNGDGVADLAVGAPAMKNEGTETGAVVVYFGGERGIDSSVSPVVLWGPLERARYGASIACPGDLDLDGCDELLVGAPGAARPAGAQRTGAVEVLFLGRNESVWIWGERPNENFGFSLSAAGDVNGDGLRDFIVGAPTSTGGNLEACGRAIVFTTRLLAPLNPSVCVGGLGADDWSFRGYYTRDLRIPDFSSKLNGLLQNPLREVEDEFGNVLVEIPVVVRSESPGTLVVHDISIAYKWTALVDRNPSAGNLTNSLNALLSHSASGNATKTIPLVLTSATPGSVRVHSPRIVIDEPPSCREDVAVELPEDTRNEHLLDLRSVFSDDFDNEELVFSLEGWTNASIVSLGISGGRWLSADALTGEANDNWTGEVEAAVSAMDRRNLSRTARVLVSVVPVNDPPVFTGDEPPHEATVGRRLRRPLSLFLARGGSRGHERERGHGRAALDAGAGPAQPELHRDALGLRRRAGELSILAAQGRGPAHGREVQQHPAPDGIRWRDLFLQAVGPHGRARREHRPLAIPFAGGDEARERDRHLEPPAHERNDIRGRAERLRRLLHRRAELESHSSQPWLAQLELRLHLPLP